MFTSHCEKLKVEPSLHQLKVEYEVQNTRSQYFVNIVAPSVIGAVLKEYKYGFSRLKHGQPNTENSLYTL